MGKCLSVWCVVLITTIKIQFKRFANDFVLFCFFYFILHISFFCSWESTISHSFLIKSKWKPLRRSFFVILSPSLYLSGFGCHLVSLLSLCLFPGFRVLASRVAHPSHFKGVPQGRQMLHPSTIIATTLAASSSFAKRWGQNQLKKKS